MCSQVRTQPAKAAVTLLLLMVVLVVLVHHDQRSDLWSLTCKVFPGRRTSSQQSLL